MYERLGQEIGQLVDKKQAAYGNSFDIMPEIFKLLYPSGITEKQYGDLLTIIRIMDKIIRISRGNKEAFGENPYKDIAGYGLLGVGTSERKNR